jgi:DNA polymerase-4
MISYECMINWLFLDLDSYFASCEQQARPDLRGRPVGIVPVLADTSCCIAASREAKKHGVKTGTLLRDAKLLCPDITFVIARHDLYTLYHKTITEAVESCLPIDSIISIDEMICRLTGSQRELPNALKLAAKIKDTLRARVGDTLTCTIGLAANRFLAKVGSDMNKPNGLTIIRREDLPAALYPLKLQDFPGIGPRMARRLAEHGILTTQELLQRSKSEMSKLWGGVVGERFYDWLRGEEVELSHTTHRSLGHQHVLEPEFRTDPGAWRVAKKLLVKAAARLRREGYYARRLAVRVRFMGDLSWEKDIRIEETQDTLVAIAALRRLWRMRPTGIPFMAAVTFYDLVPKNRHQLSLLVNPRRENLGEAMDFINTKYGKGTLSVGDLDRGSAGAPTRISFSRVPDLEEF